MKKAIIKKITIFITVFIVSVSIIIGAGFYKNSLTKETGAISVGLKGDKIKPITYDIADQGIPKRIVQPNQISIASGHGVGVTNDTEEPISIQVRAKDFPYDVVITSTDTSFDKESGTFSKPIEVGKGVNISVTFEIPRKNIKENDISNGNIEFINVKSGEVITTQPINIINSNA